MKNGWTKRIEELEAEVAKLTAALQDKPDQSDLDALVFRINHLEAENRRLREALDGIVTVSRIICNDFPVGTASLYGWVLSGEQALKEASHE